MQSDALKRNILYFREDISAAIHVDLSHYKFMYNNFKYLKTKENIWFKKYISVFLYTVN